MGKPFEIFMSFATYLVASYLATYSYLTTIILNENASQIQVILIKLNVTEFGKPTI